MVTWTVDVPGGMPVTPLPLGPSQAPAVPAPPPAQPRLRIGEGDPVVLPSDVESSMYFDSASGSLWVMRSESGSRTWSRVAGGSSGGSSPSGGAVPPSVVEAITAAGDPAELTGDQKDALLAKLIEYVAAKEGVS